MANKYYYKDNNEEYILDINSYELTANITIESNKNTNIYIVQY